MIEQIEYIHWQLHAHTFSQLVVLHYTEIKIPEARSDQGIAAQATKVRRAGKAATLTIKRAGDFESGEVKKLAGFARAGERFTHEIGPSKEFATAVEVTFKQVIDIDRLARSKRQHTIEGPTGTETSYVTYLR